MKQLFFLLMFVSVLSLIACDDTVDVGTVIESIEGREALLGVPESVPPEPPPAVIHESPPPEVLAAMKLLANRSADNLLEILAYTGTDSFALERKRLLIEKGVTDMMGLYAWQKDFYRYIDAEGIAIVGPKTVTDREFRLAREAIVVMTSKRPELRNRVLSKHGKFFMVLVSDYKENHAMPYRLIPNNWQDLPVTLPGCNANVGMSAEAIRGYCWAPVRRQPNNKFGPMRTLLHEFAHGTDESIEALSPTFAGRMQAAWETSRQLGTWDGTDLNRNHWREYWAEAIEAWFYDIGPCHNYSNFGRILIDTYDDLFQRDPLLFELLDEWFPRISLRRSEELSVQNWCSD